MKGRLLRWQTWLLIVVCIVVNLVGRIIAAKLVLPFWLDAIGTLSAAIVFGPVGGAVCGLLTNLILGLESVSNLAYAIVSVGIGVSVGYFYPRAKKHDFFMIIATSVFAGIVAVILSTPLNMLLYAGRTGNEWGDGLIDMISQDVNVPLLCTILGEAFVDIPDKALSVIIATGAIQIYRKYFKNRLIKATSMLLLISLCGIFFGMDVHAQNYGADYAPTMYDTDEGLATIEINALTQTNDGFIWAGTYAGLYRCDGARFYEINLDDRISNVMQMYVDMNGRLWIGTNDSGIACYNPDTKDIVFYDMESGFPSNSIRSICEDDEGNIYVGTVTSMAMIRTDGTLKVFDDYELYGVRSITSRNNVVAGVTNQGELFFLRDEKFVCKTTLDEDNVSFEVIEAGPGDEYLVGTSDNFVVKVRLQRNDILIGKKYAAGDARYFNKLLYSEDNNGYFYCCESGNGFITEEGKVTDLSTDSFNSAVSDVIVDYQGNLWYASNKQGIIRYSWNPFQDIFAKAKVPGDVVNSVLIHNGLLYVGTNSGLKTIDLKTYYSVPIDNPELFDGVRIRDITEDSKGNLWFSTYGKDGLIEIKNDGIVQTFNEKTKGTEGSKFRLAVELSDGTILASTSTGLNYIKGGDVVATLGEKDGINAQILSLVETDAGTVLAASDGDGLYVIRNGEIIGHIGEEAGLDSLVILKIVPCGDSSYILVSSNSLYYYSNGNARKLNKFPYKNNYDVFLAEDGNAWVCSSAGIYIVDKEELINNGEYNYTLLNKSRGLYSSLTANSKNAFMGGSLYLCCADGVRRIPVNTDDLYDTQYSIRISKLVAEDNEVLPQSDGSYVIPAVSGRIHFEIAVLNFALSNPLLHIYLEGAQDSGITCLQKDIQPLTYMNLPFGDYELHVQVLDVSGSEVVRDEVFKVVKESQIFERLYFKVYLFTVCVLFVLFLGWLIGSIRAGITNLEHWQQEAKIDPMTGFWNKGFSQQELTLVCSKDKGLLMVIDLDNFKLVNDLHGHETGDKVLIRFAELIRSCIRDGDFAGRIGGDEFIVFINGTAEESAVAEKARYLNEEIQKAGVAIVGSDFSIPLGVSIGAVPVPDEGTDYPELFRMADKALYNVKQNGKHGYAVYRNSSSNITDTGTEQGSNLAGLRMILGERGGSKGAYLVDFDKLQMVYRLFVRMSKRTFVNIWIVQFTLTNDDGYEVAEDVMERFVEVLSLNLRSNDVVAPNGKNKVIVIMTDTGSREGQTPLERIVNKWNETPGHEGYTLKYETEDM